MSGKIFADKGPDAFSFHGRTDRREWLWLTIQCGAMTYLAGLIPIVGPFLAIPFIVRLVAASSRRLHDSELSAWLLAVPVTLVCSAMGLFLALQASGLADYGRLMGGALPSEVTLDRMIVLASSYSELRGPTAIEWIPIVLWWLASFSILVIFLAVLVAPGARGPNRYGEAGRR
jgi:uncharacterized membrane protein YhaH (DUF805 family)